MTVILFQYLLIISALVLGAEASTGIGAGERARPGSEEVRFVTARRGDDICGEE